MLGRSSVDVVVVNMPVATPVRRSERQSTAMGGDAPVPVQLATGLQG